MLHVHSCSPHHNVPGGKKSIVGKTKHKVWRDVKNVWMSWDNVWWNGHAPRKKWSSIKIKNRGGKKNIKTTLATIEARAKKEHKKRQHKKVESEICCWMRTTSGDFTRYTAGLRCPQSCRIAQPDLHPEVFLHFCGPHIKMDNMTGSQNVKPKHLECPLVVGLRRGFPNPNL